MRAIKVATKKGPKKPCPPKPKKRGKVVKTKKLKNDCAIQLRLPTAHERHIAKAAKGLNRHRNDVIRELIAKDIQEGRI